MYNIEISKTFYLQAHVYVMAERLTNLGNDAYDAFRDWNMKAQPNAMARLHTLATEYLDMWRKPYENCTPLLSIHTHSDAARMLGARGWVITMIAPQQHFLFFG